MDSGHDDDKSLDLLYTAKTFDILIQISDGGECVAAKHPPFTWDEYSLAASKTRTGSWVMLLGICHLVIPSMLCYSSGQVPWWI